MIEDVIELPLDNVEQFTMERLEEEYPMILMGFSEDDLIFINSIAKQLIDLSLIIGSEPPIELTALECRFDEAIHQFYGEEE